MRHPNGVFDTKVIRRDSGFSRANNPSLSQVVFGSLDPKMGWTPLAKGGVQVRLVDGFHRNMHIAPYAGSLASELRKFLDEDARGGDSPRV